MAESRAPALAEYSVTDQGIVVDNDIALLRVWDTRLQSAIPSGDPATTARRRELREFCRRLLGTSIKQTSLVDDAVDGLLASAARGVPIALRGVSDLVPVAYALHRKLFGAERPFVVCDPRRREGADSVRVPPSRPTGLLALESAKGGSLCMNARRLPPDFERLRDALRQGESGAAVFVCLPGGDGLRDLLCRPLEILPLSARASEWDFLLEESLVEAASTLGTARLRIPRHLRHGVIESVGSFAELEKTALRLVALATGPNLSQAAKRLGIAPVSLSRWLHHRPWLAALLNDLENTVSAPTPESIFNDRTIIHHEQGERTWKT